MTDDKKRESHIEEDMPVDEKIHGWRDGKPDPIRAAAEEIDKLPPVSQTSLTVWLDLTSSILRVLVERETRECAKMALRYSKPLEQMMLDRIRRRRQGGEEREKPQEDKPAEAYPCAACEEKGLGMRRICDKCFGRIRQGGK